MVHLAKNMRRKSVGLRHTGGVERESVLQPNFTGGSKEVYADFNPSKLA